MTNVRTKLFVACLTAIGLCVLADVIQAQGRRSMSNSGGKNLGTVPNFWSGNNNSSNNNNNNNWGWGNSSNNNNNSRSRRSGSANSNRNPWQTNLKTQPGRAQDLRRRNPNSGGKYLGTVPELSIQGRNRSNSSNNRTDSSNNIQWGELFGGSNSNDRDYNRSGSRRRWYDSRYRDRYYDDYYPSGRYESSTRYPSSSSTYVESTAVVPNELPAKKTVKLQANAEPGVGTLEPISAETYRLAGDVVRDTARETLDQLVQDLGPAAADPQVQRRIEELTAKIENGREISEDDVNKLVRAAVNSGKLQDASGRIPLARQDLLNESLDKLVGLSQALHILDKPFPADGTIPDVPTGTIYVVTCPPLGEDQMLVLPGGNVLCGTGGEGEFGAEATYASDLFGMQMGFGEPLPEGFLQPEDMLTSGVLVLNPPDNTGTVNVTYAGRSYTLKPGGEEYFTEAGQVARFDRGKGKGQARYKLTDGTFLFTPTDDKGWELYKQSFSVTIDNSANESAFRYVVDDEQHQVAGGRTMTHKSKYPLIIRFDRGRGSETSKDIVMSDETLVVAVNPQDGLWDLYAAENFPEFDGDDKLARGNSSAQAALLRERNKLSSVSKRQRFNVMKPAAERTSSRSNRSWDDLRAQLNAELATPETSQDDPLADSLPMPIGE